MVAEEGVFGCQSQEISLSYFTHQIINYQYISLQPIYNKIATY